MLTHLWLLLTDADYWSARPVRRDLLLRRRRWSRRFGN